MSSVTSQTADKAISAVTCPAPSLLRPSSGSELFAFTSLSGILGASHQAQTMNSFSYYEQLIGKRSVSTSGRSVSGCGRWPDVGTYESVHLGNKWTLGSG